MGREESVKLIFYNEVVAGDTIDEIPDDPAKVPFCVDDPFVRGRAHGKGGVDVPCLLVD